MTAFWQAKIWGLLHDPVLKPLHNNTGRGQESIWKELAVMKDWVDQEIDPSSSGKKLLKHIRLADLIASASDRGAIGSLITSVNYGNSGLDLFHLLSGERLNFQLHENIHQQLKQTGRLQHLNEIERQLFSVQLNESEDDIHKKSVTEITRTYALTKEQKCMSTI